jgi:hypothetical protein
LTVSETRPAVSVGQVLLAIAAVATAVSIFLSWIDVSDPRGFTESGTDAPLAFLYDKDTASTSPSVAILLLPIAGLMLLSAVMRNMRWFAVCAGLAAIAVAGLFAFQSSRFLDDLPALARVDLTEFLGIGVYVAAGAGVLAIVGGLLPRRSTGGGVRIARPESAPPETAPADAPPPGP